jgi:hypothetical protein
MIRANPAVLRRLVAGGKELKPFSQPIIGARLKASNEVNAETVLVAGYATMVGVSEIAPGTCAGPRTPPRKGQVIFSKARLLSRLRANRIEGWSPVIRFNARHESSNTSHLAGC